MKANSLREKLEELTKYEKDLTKEVENLRIIKKNHEKKCIQTNEELKIILERIKKEYDDEINLKNNNIKTISYQRKDSYPTIQSLPKIINAKNLVLQTSENKPILENKINNNKQETNTKNYRSLTNIFGENFVENNKDKCILIGEKIYQLTEKINYKTEKTFFEILFVELEKISNYSNMFSKSNLLTFKNIKEQNKISKNIENTEINNMKNNLDNSDDRKDIYKSLDTFIESTINEDDHKIFSNKATIINNDKMLSFYDFDVSYMFNECSLLKSLSLSN